MAAYHVIAVDVKKILQEKNVQTAAGKLKNNMTEYNVSVNSELASAEEFDNIIVKRSKSFMVRLKDIGYAELGAQNKNSSVIINGKSGIIVAPAPTNHTGNIALADRIVKLIHSLQMSAPKGIKFSIVWNTSRFRGLSV